MRKIVHMSDLHFGRTDDTVVESLIETVNQIQPDLVVVSGDLTQRAKSREFAAARAFLDRLPQPQIVVPGNHDVPLYNVYKRFVSPLKGFTKYITCDLRPFYRDDEVAVVGVNTARSLTIKDGRISKEQVAEISARFSVLDDRFFKIVVTHHPFDLPAGFSKDHLVDRAEKAMPEIAESGADIFLSGHLHVSNITDSAIRYRLASGRSGLIIQAGTATSTRGRGESNSFNLLECDGDRLTVQHYEYLDAKRSFSVSSEYNFAKTAAGWTATAIT